MCKHETVLVHVDGMYEDIDKGIAPLIQQLSEADILTDFSCEEFSPGVASVGFLRPRDCTRFLDIVADPEAPDSLYERITKGFHDDDKNPDTVYWEFYASPRDISKCDPQARVPEFKLGVAIYFPITDIPYLVHRMTHHNADL